MANFENLNVVNFCYDRRNEISSFHELLDQDNEPYFAAQANKIVRCQRRRTTSFKRFKIPRINKIKGTNLLENLKKRKAPRKDRRRPRLLLALRRNNNHCTGTYTSAPRWLETHIWHTKRMRMENIWGYSIPRCHSGRGLKFVRSSVAQAAIVHDRSYLELFEVSCVEGIESICTLLSLFLDPNSSIILEMQEAGRFDNKNHGNQPAEKQQEVNSSKEVAAGPAVVSEVPCCEQQVIFFSQNSFPHECLGPGSVMLLPNSCVTTTADSMNTASPAVAGDTMIDNSNEGSPSYYRLWLWLHPAYSATLYGQLQSAVHDMNSSVVVAETTAGREGCRIMVQRISPSLNRFSIRGNDATSILSRVFRPDLLSSTDTALAADDHPSSSAISISPVRDTLLEPKRSRVRNKDRGSTESPEDYVARFFDLSAKLGVDFDASRYWPNGKALTLSVRDCRDLRFSSGGMTMCDDDIIENESDNRIGHDHNSTSVNVHVHLTGTLVKTSVIGVKRSHHHALGDQSVHNDIINVDKHSSGSCSSGGAKRSKLETASISRSQAHEHTTTESSKRTLKRNERRANRLMWPDSRSSAQAISRSLFFPSGRSVAFDAFVSDHEKNSEKSRAFNRLFFGQNDDEDGHANIIGLGEREKATPSTAMGRPQPEKEGKRRPVVLSIILIRRSESQDVEGFTSMDPQKLAGRKTRDRTRGIVYSDGWDVVLPTNWGACFWRALQYAGARAVGYEEFDRIFLNSGVPAFPRDYPDTVSGSAYWHRRWQQDLKNYDRKIGRHRYGGWLAARSKKANSLGSLDMLLTRCMNIELRLCDNPLNADNHVPISTSSDDAATSGACEAEVKTGLDKYEAASAPLIEVDASRRNDQTSGSQLSECSISIENAESVVNGDCNTEDSKVNLMVIRSERYFTSFRPFQYIPVENQSEGSQMQRQRSGRMECSRRKRSRLSKEEGICDERTGADNVGSRSTSTAKKYKLALQEEDNIPVSMPPGNIVLVSVLLHPSSRGVARTGARIVSALQADCAEWLLHRWNRRRPVASQRRRHQRERRGDRERASSTVSDDYRDMTQHRGLSVLGSNVNGDSFPFKRLGDWRGVDLRVEGCSAQSGSSGNGRVGSHDKEECGQAYNSSSGTSAGSRRLVLGLVTSGQENSGDGRKVSLGLCDVLSLRKQYQCFWKTAQALSSGEMQHAWIASDSTSAAARVGDCAGSSIGTRTGVADEVGNSLSGHWCSSRFGLVLFQNPGSSWLRPALIEYRLLD